MKRLKNYAYLLTFLLCLPLASVAQESFGIVGTVVDSNGVVIESGNVIILSPVDSTVIKGIDFWDGKFELLGLETKDVILKVTADGYITLFESRSWEPDTSALIDIGTIRLAISEQNLEGVDIVATKPMFERKLGKLIVNVEGTILSERGTLLELLKSAPNVIVKSSGQVIVVGRGAAIIYLDGQRINSVEMLSSISSNDVSRIEVIENPSAKYDAEGNAVIEIITKNGARDGYEGSLMLRGMHRTENQLWYRGQFSFRKKWFSFYVSGGQFAGTLHEKEEYHRVIYGTPTLTMDNDIDRTFTNKFNPWLYIDTDFRLDSVNTLFLTYNTYQPTVESGSVNTNRIFEDGTEIGSLDSETSGLQERRTHSLSSGYHRSLDTLGSEFRITGQYTTFDAKSSSDITQVSNFGTPVESIFQSSNFNTINVFAGQFDYSKKINEKFGFELGAKNSFVTNTSGVDFEYLENDQWLVDSTIFNQFDYEENILAGYGEVAGEHKKFSYQAGLRYEWTTNVGNSLISGAGVVDKNYHNVFPNVQLSYDITKDLIIGATYSNRINRPTYQDLDPFVNYIDSLSSFRGNPQLLPSYANSAELSLIFMEYASLKFGYTKTKDPMFLTVQKNTGTNTFSAIVKNIESSETYSLGIVLPYELPWWTTFNAFGYDFNEYRFTDNAIPLVNNKPTYYVSLYNEFRFKKLFNLELTYEYVSPGAQGIFIVKPYQTIGASITRKFLKDKLTLRFSVFDMLYQEIESAESALEDFFVSYSSRSDTQTMMLAATWNFGKLKNQELKSKNIARDEKNRIKE